ncbi:hypothetical protein BCR42DRAFT_123047 [Absidia repens]|uniref:Uncharacterized protein n=1 Tax=Absidia repens TaxID=90262 RepID=A0A1X2I4Y9_9FUNG|nr:hypothetical protein BCR42DRAFT_123047 [Absidia repens]
MVETPINVILDGDMIAYSEKTSVENNPSIDPTHILPPVPIWSCMVDGTLNFCRLVWDLYRDSKVSKRRF